MSAFVVVGGAGRTGRRVCERLVRGGHDVVVASRRAGTPLDLTGDPDPAVFTGAAGAVVVVEPPREPEAAEAAMHHGVAAIARIAAKAGFPVVLVSQIYVTRAPEHPDMRTRIEARARGEQALRDAGARYAIVRPSWLHDLPAAGVRIEQGDTGEGRISRDAVADAVVAALFDPTAWGKTFELYDDEESSRPEWTSVFPALHHDRSDVD